MNINLTIDSPDFQWQAKATRLHQAIIQILDYLNENELALPANPYSLDSVTALASRPDVPLEVSENLRHYLKENLPYFSYQDAIDGKPQNEHAFEQLGYLTAYFTEEEKEKHCGTQNRV